jgi:Fic family protein
VVELSLTSQPHVHSWFDEGVKGFEGGMKANKYISLTKTSKATATRDLQELIEKGILKVGGGGRSSRYDLIILYNNIKPFYIQD